eukprot:GFUD01032108.1.p1 GENE.GFUD01032108.1~~GFUD01032108.1.p1  ORF type:complete len:278 (+),score=53.53 GFUD01032108.1:144-977(+)
MLLDCMLWLGLGTVGVVLILLGCRLVMDFPGLLDWNILQVFKEIEDDSNEPIEGLIDNKDTKWKSKISKKCDSSQCLLSVGPAREQLALDEGEISTEKVQSNPPTQCQLSKCGKDDPRIMSRPDQCYSRTIDSQPCVSKSVEIQSQDSGSAETMSHSSVPVESKPTLSMSGHHTVSHQPMPGTVTIQLNNGVNEISIVIKQQLQKQDISINIDFPDTFKENNNTKVSDTVYETLAEECEVSSTNLSQMNEIVPDTVEEVRTVQCGLYQTKESAQRQC